MIFSKRAYIRVSLLIALTTAGTVVTLAGCRGDFVALVSGDDFVSTGRTLSIFTAIQVDPPDEDSAGPQSVVAADLNGDGLLDLVSAWNQSQPVQIHLQRLSPSGAISFETVTLAGNIPVVRVAGLAVEDFDGDGRADIAVLVKETGLLPVEAECLDSSVPTGGVHDGIIILYLAPAPELATSALAWAEVPIHSSHLAGVLGSGALPEEDGFTAMAVGDINLDGRPDIVTAWNPGGCSGDPTVVIFTNQGFGAVRDGTWRRESVPDAFSKGGRIKDVALGDIEGDGDLDVVVSYPDAVSMNVRWYRNPLVDVEDDVHISDGQWQTGVVGHIAPMSGGGVLGGADTLLVADIDNDGVLDVVARSSGGQIIQWLKGPPAPTSLTSPIIGGTIRHIPWQVYTIAEFPERLPHAIALGDINKDGQLDLIASADGAISWFSASSGASVYNRWAERLIIDDSFALSTGDPADPGSAASGRTFINSIFVADIDGDGRTDFVATLDRNELSGLTNDLLVWFRNRG
jgi:hypothetical protein